MRAKIYEINKNDNLESSIPKYIEFLRNNPSYTAVFNISSQFKIFSKYKVDNVVFLIRHPLHSYCSWSKDIRHGDLTEKLGGKNSKSSIEFFMKRWISQIDEYITLKELKLFPVLLRYEFIYNDVKNIPELKWVFNDFDASKRNFNFLNIDSESFLYDYVKDWYFKIYPKWII